MASGETGNTIDTPSARRLDVVCRKVLGDGDRDASPAAGRPREPETVWARLTAADASDPVNYSWSEVYQDDAGDWQEVDGGRTGTDTVQPANAIATGLTYTTDPTTGDIVLLRRRRVKDTGDDTWTPGWVIVSPTVGGSANGVMVKVEAALSGGQYEGHIYDQGTQGADGSGDFAPPEGLTVGESVLILNQDEQGTAQNRISLDTYAAGFFLPGVSVEGSPRRVVLIPRGQYVAGAPIDVGSSDLDVGGDQFAAAATSWATGLLAPGTETYTGVPISFPVVTRIDVVAGPQIRYTVRVLSFDADGRLASISTGNVSTSSV